MVSAIETWKHMGITLNIFGKQQIEFRKCGILIFLETVNEVFQAPKTFTSLLYKSGFVLPFEYWT